MIEQKRLTAQKCTIKDIICGKYNAQDSLSPNHVLTEDGRKLSRVHILATAVSTYISDDGKYGFIVLDDGTGMIRLKAFQDTALIKKAKKGDILDVIGRTRQYNDETHIYPEIIKRINDPNCETLRKIELVKMISEQKSKSEIILTEAKKHKDVEELKKELETRNIKTEDIENVLGAQSVREEKEEKEGGETDTKAAKSIVLKAIEELDKGGGTEYAMVIEKAGLPEAVCESAIDELLEEGSCYEPRAGKLKAL